MKRQSSACIFLAICLFIAFVVWTILVCIFDVMAIGPKDSSVGFATLNEFVHRLTGVNMALYIVTDWLGLFPFAVALGFAIFGFIQLIKRKSIFKVDFSILILGVFYIVVFSVYILFEYVVINYRPILINGILEASYPSSTTMLVSCVMPTALIQFNARIKNKGIRKFVVCVISTFTAFMIVGRFISGVHWFSDIIGGLLFSSSLVLAYFYICRDELNKLKNLSN